MRIAGYALKREGFDIEGAQQGFAILHQRAVILPCPVPFQHGELGIMELCALFTAENRANLVDFGEAGDEEFFHRKFRAIVQVA